MKISKLTRLASTAAMALALSSQGALAVEAAAVSGVNVRSGPGVQFGRVDTLFRNESVNITECQNNWCYVQHSGPNGWVSANYLAVINGSGGDTGSGTDAQNNNNNNDAATAAILGLIIGGVLAGANNHTPPAATPAPLPYGPDTCKQGYVWREAIPGDHVCVRPQARSKAAHENAISGLRVNPYGAYGPNSCKIGFVWRGAYSGDKVCVTSARRSHVHQENVNGPSHRVQP